MQYCTSQKQQTQSFSAVVFVSKFLRGLESGTLLIGYVSKFNLSLSVCNS